MAEVAHLLVLGQRLQGGAQALGFDAVGAEHIVFLEDLQRRQSGAAGQGVTGVGMRVQEAAGDVAAVEGLVDFITRHHQRQRQVAAADALGKAQEVRPHAGLLASEEGAGAAAADGDFVEDQMDPMAVAQFAHQLQVQRIVHRHAGGALHQRLDDDGGDLVATFIEQALDIGGSAARYVLCSLAFASLARIRRHYRLRGAQQWTVGVLEQRHIGDGQRAYGLAVIAAFEADEFLLASLAVVAPRMEAHFQGDFHRRRTVAGVEAVAQHMAGQCG